MRLNTSKDPDAMPTFFEESHAILGSRLVHRSKPKPCFLTAVSGVQPDPQKGWVALLIVVECTSLSQGVLWKLRASRRAPDQQFV